MTHFVLMICFLLFLFEGLTLGSNIPDFYEIVTAPITKVCISSHIGCH